MKEHPFDPSLLSSLELVAYMHVSESRYLFGVIPGSLLHEESFEATIVHGLHVILVFPVGKFHINRYLAASASNWVIMPGGRRIT